MSSRIVIMDPFFKVFFRKLNYTMIKTRVDNYCAYYNSLIEGYLSSIFCSTAVVVVPSFIICTKLGRRWPLLLGFSSLFLICHELFNNISFDSFYWKNCHWHRDWNHVSGKNYLQQHFSNEFSFFLLLSSLMFFTFYCRLFHSIFQSLPQLILQTS